MSCAGKESFLTFFFGDLMFYFGVPEPLLTFYVLDCLIFLLYLKIKSFMSLGELDSEDCSLEVAECFLLADADTFVLLLEGAGSGLFYTGSEFCRGL